MKIVKTIKEVREEIWSERIKGKKIGFVPTMGFLHEGHLSLLREGKARGDDLVLSIFVNPTQFGPAEDLDAYPQDIEKDLDFARKEGVSVVFTPSFRFCEINFSRSVTSISTAPYIFESTGLR